MPTALTLRPIEPGTPVRITDGPLKGRAGELDHLHQRQPGHPAHRSPRHRNPRHPHPGPAGSPAGFIAGDSAISSIFKDAVQKPTNFYSMTDTNGHNTNGYNGRYRGEEIANQYSGQAGTSAREDNDDEIDLRQIFGLLWHNKWIIIALTLLGGVSAYIYAQSQIPIYESNGSLQITEAGNRYSMAGSDLSNLMVSNFGIGMGSSIENEIHVLQSRTFTWGTGSAYLR